MRIESVTRLERREACYLSPAA